MAKLYNIPVNFNRSGYVFNGLLETRKAVEAVCGLLIGFVLCKLLPLRGLFWSIIAHVFVMGILGLLGLFGVRGDPFSVFLANFLRWRKQRKRPYIYNPNGMSFVDAPARMILEEQDAGDFLADLSDALRAKFAKKKPTYEEGKNFKFAEDPLLERLANIEQRQKEEQEEQNAEDAADQAPAPEGVDLTSILEGIDKLGAEGGGQQ